MSSFLLFYLQMSLPDLEALTLLVALQRTIGLYAVVPEGQFVLPLLRFEIVPESE